VTSARFECRQRLDRINLEEDDALRACKEEMERAGQDPILFLVDEWPDQLLFSAMCELSSLHAQRVAKLAPCATEFSLSRYFASE